MTTPMTTDNPRTKDSKPMLQLAAIFAFMLFPIWLILASVTIGWIGDRFMRFGRGGNSLVVIRAMRADAEAHGPEPTPRPLAHEERR